MAKYIDRADRAQAPKTTAAAGAVKRNVSPAARARCEYLISLLPDEADRAWSLSCLASQINDRGTRENITALELQLGRLGISTLAPIDSAKYESKLLDKNLDKNHGDADTCALCGNRVKPETAREIHKNTNGQILPIEATVAENEDMGWYSVGPECAKKLPAGYVTGGNPEARTAPATAPPAAKAPKVAPKAERAPEATPDAKKAPLAILAKLDEWLDLNADIIKPKGLAERCGISPTQLSRLRSGAGRADASANKVLNLVAEAGKFGFTYEL